MARPHLLTAAVLLIDYAMAREEIANLHVPFMHMPAHLEWPGSSFPFGKQSSLAIELGIPPRGCFHGEIPLSPPLNFSMRWLEKSPAFRIISFSSYKPEQHFFPAQPSLSAANAAAKSSRAIPRPSAYPGQPRRLSVARCTASTSHYISPSVTLVTTASFIDNSVGRIQRQSFFIGQTHQRKPPAFFQCGKGAGDQPGVARIIDDTVRAPGRPSP